jgi:hypothetical protein
MGMVMTSVQAEAEILKGRQVVTCAQVKFDIVI